MDLGSKDIRKDGFWIFGYGSLIWKPPPHYDERVPGYVEGYVRRFWQASQDHRGTPESPGRVVTLIERSFWSSLKDNQKSNRRVWGAAYHIIPERAQEVQEYLDIREINGYSIQYTAFHPTESGREDIQCIVYIGMPNNDQFLGALDPKDVAETINESIGPSGENREYLLQLEESLSSLSAEARDEHISDLAGRVRNMKAPIRDLDAIRMDQSHLHKVNSTEEQEEIERDS